MLPRWQKLLLLTSLYISQGLPYGFLTQAVPSLMRMNGASLTAIGDTTLLFAPWLLKVFWAPIVDRYWWAAVGRRRSWLIPLQILSIVVICGLATRTPEHAIQALLGFMFVSSLISATQDIATDGLAVQLLTANERGWGNGIQVGGYRLGMILGGSILLILFAQLSWSVSFYVMGLLIFGASIPVFFIREPPEPPSTDILPSPWSFIQRPGAWLWLFLLITYKLGEQMAGSVTRPMLVDLGFSLQEIGWLAGMDSLCSLLGAIFGGLLLGFIPRKKALVGYGLLQALGVAAWALPNLLSTENLFIVVTGVKLIDGFVGSMATVALFTTMMDRCDPRNGGTEYTLQASVVLIAGFIGATTGGRLADTTHLVLEPNLAYPVFFAITALLTTAGALAMLLDRSWDMHTLVVGPSEGSKAPHN